MNQALRKLAAEYQIELPKHEILRIAFGLDCVDRVLIHITDTEALAAYKTGRDYCMNKCEESTFKTAVESILRIARSQKGSSGIDGTGNAAVSATNALAKAMSGDAVNAADYAAYASVYAYSSHATTDPQAYMSEYQWQIERLQERVSAMS